MPVLKPGIFTYSKIYLIPSPNQIVLIPEAQYILNQENWAKY